MAPQSDEANLARIRDNQRRSRARRKEYQQELEQRVRAFEEQGVEASTEVQRAARRVADENKKLRRLLQQSGVSHAAVEAYLHGGNVGDVDDIGDSGDSGPPGANVATLEHLMVPRFPLQYASPLLSGGSLSAAGSVGPSSPLGGGGVDETTTTSTAGDSSSHRDGSSVHGKSHSHSHSHGHSHGHGHGHGHRDKGKRASSTSTSGTMTTTGTSTADYASYLSPGYGLSTAFYGLDETSAEDLHYGSSSGGGRTEAGGAGGVGTGAEPILFDYSVSPQYLGEGGGSTAFGTGSASGVSQPPGSAAYYGMMGSGGAGGSGNTTGSYVRTCPACMSGMGCQVHGGFFEE